MFDAIPVSDPRDGLDWTPQIGEDACIVGTDGAVGAACDAGWRDGKELSF